MSAAIGGRANAPRRWGFASGGSGGAGVAQWSPQRNRCLDRSV